MKFKSKYLVTCTVIVAASSWPASADFLHAKAPLKNRYIVTLKQAPTLDVESTAKALAGQFGGRLLGTMSHAMKGFGINMTDAHAHALSNHPFVALIEEDQPIYTSEEAPFSFRDAYRPPLVEQAHLFPRVNANNCPWAGSWYQCSYGDDLTWSLDQLDNQG